MKRRSFIKRSAAASVPLFLGGVPVSAVARNAFSNFINPDSDKVLVLIQLNGGNDGLNCVIPRDQYSALSMVRPDVILPENTLLDITDTVSFHPSMANLKNIYDNGELNVIQSVGYPNQNRSHFRSTDIWHTASDADEFILSGWLGRYFDAFYANYPEQYPNDEYPDPFAITIGSTVSETCQGMAGNFSLAIGNPEDLTQLATPLNNELADGCYLDKLNFLSQTIQQTNEYGEVIQAADEMGSNSSTVYPDDNALAQKLKIVAKLINGGLSTKVYIVSLGGFDTHANQVQDGDPTTGLHADLLQTLSDAIYSFQEDIKNLGLDQRVVGMTYSEFGRQIRSNASFGTDHGTAAPLLVFGSCVQSGITGDNPEISTDVDPQEGVAMQYDFRSVYGSILTDWFDVDAQVVEEVLLGAFQKLPIIEMCSTTSTDNYLETNVPLKTFPNPFENVMTIEFESKREHVRISVFDAIGNEVKVVTSQQFPEGKHQVKFEGHQLPRGAYFVRIQTQSGQQTKRVVKM
jgi:uncharacterized protein (DUF1501 family)